MSDAAWHWGGGEVLPITKGVFPSNAYACTADVPGGCILIDPGLDAPGIDEVLTERGLQPWRVFCTHGHFDHAGGAAYFQRKYGCEVFLHSADRKTLQTSNFLLMALKIAQRVELAEPTYVEDGFHCDVAGHALRFRHVPGHTPGSCVIELGSAWFTGDTLYAHGVGLSRLPGENHAHLKRSLLGLWDGLTAERTIHPGHGPSTDGASVRTGNAALRRFLGADIAGAAAAEKESP